MNLNTILDILLNQRLGIVEYKLDYLYPEIMNNLRTNTLPIFSQYFPCYRRFEYVPRHYRTDVEHEFYLDIPEIVENKLNIISIAEVQPKTGFENVYFLDSYRPYAMTIEDVIMNSMATNIASQSAYSYRMFHFIPPNRVRLKGYGESELYMTLKVTYPTFSAIPDSVIEQFLDLAECDIKIFIYNKLKHFDQLQMPVGQVDLKLAKLEDGESERKDVIERFRTKGFANTSARRYYTYE